MRSRFGTWAAMAAACAFVLTGVAGAQVIVYNNFAGPGHEGWDYAWGTGWTVAGEALPTQYGVEQAMRFDATIDGIVSDVWVAMWYVPLDPQPDVVTLRLARALPGLPPAPEDVLEEWTITGFSSWSAWSPPKHVTGGGLGRLEAGSQYWLWASAGSTTWCGWCLNIDPAFLCSHTLRREGQDWLDIALETASAFRVDAWPIADLNCDGAVNVFDIDPFVLALTSPAEYEVAFAGCFIELADCNGDGLVNAFDIDPFVEILTGG
jgi:hypothetical protein